MKIDPKVEPLVRDVLTAAIRSNSEEFAEALGRFDDRNAADAVTLLGAITVFVLHQEYEGGPTSADLEEVAADVVNNEGWAELDRQAVLESLKVFQRQAPPVPPQGADPRELFASMIVTAGYLLASSTDPPKKWWQYLDEIEAALERQ